MKPRVSVVVPTFKRPDTLELLLSSLREQMVEYSQIIIVDGSFEAESVAGHYRSLLPVEYHRSPVPSQIVQRKYGLQKLQDHYDYLVLLDDDIELQPYSLDKAVHKLHANKNIMGVGLNLTTAPAFEKSWLRSLAGMGGDRPGQMLSSSYNTSIGSASYDFVTQWLGGGYSVWRKTVLEEFDWEPLQTRWAIGEDVRFSYPIGKKYELWVCSEARVKEHSTLPPRLSFHHASYRGYKAAGHFLYMASLYPELNWWKTQWMLLARAMAWMTQSLLLRVDKLGWAVGHLRAMLKANRLRVKKQSLKILLEDDR